MEDRDTQTRIQGLEAQVQELRNLLENLTGPMQRIFLAKRGASDVQWLERTIVSGSPIDFTDGRICDDDGDPCAELTLGPDDFVLMEVPDPDGNFRYLPLRGFGVTDTLDVVINVSYNTTTHILSQTKVTLTIQNGSITDISASSDSTVNAATEGVCSS